MVRGRAKWPGNMKRDEEHYRQFIEGSKTPEGTEAYLKEWGSRFAFSPGTDRQNWWGSFTGNQHKIRTSCHKNILLQNYWFVWLPGWWKGRKHGFYRNGNPYAGRQPGAKHARPQSYSYFWVWRNRGPFWKKLPLAVGDMRTFNKGIAASGICDIMETAQRGFVEFGFFGRCPNWCLW